MCVPRVRVTQKGVVTEGEALGAGDRLTVVDRSRSVGRFLSFRGVRVREATERASRPGETVDHYVTVYSQMLSGGTSALTESGVAQFT
jgi:hypothetical protein